MRLDNFDPWELGEARNLVAAERDEDAAVRCRWNGPAAPRAAELRGDPLAAAEEWSRLGLPYEAALALMQVGGAGAGAALISAVVDVRGDRGARRRHAGAPDGAPPRRRRPAAEGAPRALHSARGHPLGLTQRELEILGLIAEGIGNREIARRLVRSPRTVEHHVSALLGKLNAANRMDVMLRLRSEPWLLPAAETRDLAKTR